MAFTLNDARPPLTNAETALHGRQDRGGAVPQPHNARHRPERVAGKTPVSPLGIIGGKHQKHAGRTMRLMAAFLAAAALAGCGGDPGRISPADPVLVGPGEETGVAGDTAATHSRAETAVRWPAAPFEVRRAAGRSPHISDEQDFDAVSSRETIESDAERIERQRRRYLLIPPAALPEQSERAGPSVVQYALSTTHPPGLKLHGRFHLLRPFRGRHVSRCAQYASADLAQEAFLSLGGPAKDRRNLDPDGDGYACGWSPERFREIARR